MRDIVLQSIPYALPLRQPYRWAKGVQTHRRGAWIVLTHPSGAQGVGEVAPPPHATDVDALLDALASLPAWLSLDAANALCGNATLSARIRCGLDSAIVTMLAAAAGLTPDAYLLNGAARTRTVRVNGLITQATAQAAGQAAGRLRAGGLGVIKIKVDASDLVSPERVRAVHQAAPDAQLRLDANESWDAAPLDAWQAFAPLPIAYVEQPFSAAHAPEDLVARTQAAPCRVFLDESAPSLEAVRDLVAAGFTGGFILKPQRLGGLRPALDIMRWLEGKQLPYTLTNSLETSIGLWNTTYLAAAGQQWPAQAMGLGTADYFATHPCPPPQVQGGCIQLPDAAPTPTLAALLQANGAA